MLVQLAPRNRSQVLIGPFVFRHDRAHLGFERSDHAQLNLGMSKSRERFEEIGQPFAQRYRTDEQYPESAIAFRLAMKHREIDAEGIESNLLARNAVVDKRAHRERRRHEDQIAKRVLFQFAFDDARIDTGKVRVKALEFIPHDFVLIFDMGRTAIAY